jgi:hypothetical protein
MHICYGYISKICFQIPHELKTQEVLAVWLNWLDRLENLGVWLCQLAQDFKKESVIDQIKIQLLRLALCLLQVMGSALWLKARKRRGKEEEDDDEYDLNFDKLSKKDMIKIKSLFERLQKQELLLEQ